jgi:hypothetical protein
MIKPGTLECKEIILQGFSALNTFSLRAMLQSKSEED